MNVLEEIKNIVEAEHKGLGKKITPKTKFQDVQEIDSLELATMVIELENIYGIRVDDSKLLELQTKTVQDLINEIEKLISSKK